MTGLAERLGRSRRKRPCAHGAVVERKYRRPIRFRSSVRFAFSFVMNCDSVNEGVLIGKGALHLGPRLLGLVTYKVHIDPANGQASIVELEPRAPAKDGAFIHLTLEDGRVINCRVLGESPFCAVIGDGPIPERRRRIRDA